MSLLLNTCKTVQDLGVGSRLATVDGGGSGSYPPHFFGRTLPVIIGGASLMLTNIET